MKLRIFSDAISKDYPKYNMLKIEMKCSRSKIFLVGEYDFVLLFENQTYYYKYNFVLRCLTPYKVTIKINCEQNERSSRFSTHIYAYFLGGCMKSFSDLPLMVKILISGVGATVLLTLILSILYYRTDKRTTVDAMVEKSRAICLITESVRSEMEDKWNKKLYTMEQVQEWVRQGQMEKVYAVIPVVSAWESAMRKAKQGGYIFRVPKFEPRNPKNKPDYGLDYEIEGPALKKIKAENLAEYYVIDKKKNAVRFFLPVKLSENCLICHGDPRQSKTLWGRDDGKDPTGGPFENWKAGEIHGAFEVIQSLDPADAQLRKRILAAGIIVTAGILFAVAILFFTARRITTPIKQGVKFASNLSKGDLSKTFEVDQNDEVGELADALNDMAGGLRDIISGINKSVEQLKTSSLDLGDASSSMSSEVNNTTGLAVNVSGAAREMSDNMDSVAAAVEETSTNVSMVAAAAEEMSATIKEIAQNTEKSREITENAVNTAENASLKIKDLGGAAQAIGNVTTTISEISEQTNLLALNATIEAARAGEAGKGFNVVANEIKELANQTSDATMDIREKINTMQKSTDDIVVEINQVTAIINEVNEIVKAIAKAVDEQATATSEIAENVSQASMGIAEVTENVAHSSQKSTEVAKDISDVSASAENISGKSDQVRKNAENLTGIADVLAELMKRFRLK